MAPINPPQYLQAGVYSARSDRLVTAAHMTPDHGTDALAMRSGVRPTPGNAGLAVTQRTTPSMFVTVAAGTAWIQSTAATGGGYLVVNDAPYDVPITTAHATLGRRDLIVARIYDAELSGTVSQWTLEVVTGAPAGSPTPPAPPPGSMALATVLVNPAATTIVNGNITDTRVYTTSLGGTTPAPATALPANPYRGQAAYDTTNLRPTWHNGTGWQSWMEDPALLSQIIIKCTSTTRPSSPSEGWHIYETDTKRFLVYQSGAWVSEGGSWERIDRRVVASGSPVSATTFSSLSSTYRLFRITFSIQTSDTSPWLRINNDTGGNYTYNRVGSTATTIEGTEMAGVNYYQLAWLTGGLTCQGEVFVSKPSAGNRGLVHGQASVHAPAHVSNPQWFQANTGNWNNASVLINRLDLLVNSGTFYGVVNLDGMQGI